MPDLKPVLYRFGEVSSNEGSHLHNPSYFNRIENLTQEYPETTAQEKVQFRKSQKVLTLWCWCHAAAAWQIAYILLGEPEIK